MGPLVLNDPRATPGSPLVVGVEGRGLPLEAGRPRQRPQQRLQNERWPPHLDKKKTGEGTFHKIKDFFLQSSKSTDLKWDGYCVRTPLELIKKVNSFSQNWELIKTSPTGRWTEK